MNSDDRPHSISAAEDAHASARRNREAFPEAAAFVDAVRAVFPDARVVYFGEPRVEAPNENVELLVDEDARAANWARRLEVTGCVVE